MANSAFSASTGTSNSANSSSNWGIYSQNEKWSLKNFKYDVFHYYYFFHKNDFHRLSIFLLAIQLLQYFSLSFSDVFTWGNSEWLGYITLLRTFGVGVINYSTFLVYFWISFVYFFLRTVFGTILGNRAVREEDVPEKFVVFLQALNYAYVPIFYIPLLYIFGNSLICIDGTLSNYPHVDCYASSTVVIFALSIIFLVQTVFGGVLNAFLCYSWLPDKKSYVSVVNPHLQILMFFTTTISVLLDIFLDFTESDKSVYLHMYGISLILGNFVLLFYTIILLPFHRKVVNVIVSACLAACTAASLVSYFSTLTKSTGYAPLIALLVLIFVCASGAAWITKYRADKLYGPVTPEDYKPFFTKEYQVEIATRNTYYMDFSVDEEYFETATTIYSYGTDQFPTSPNVKLAHAVFLLLHKRDLPTVTTLVHRGIRLEPNIALEYMFYCVDQTRAMLVSLTDGGAEEISVRIRRAKYSQEECAKNMKTFWSNLLTEFDLGSIGTIVMNIAKQEAIAEQIYKKLMRKWPKSVTVLRAYASFLEEIKSDYELAQIMYTAAEEIEEEKSTKKSHEKKWASTNKVVPFVVESDEETGVEKIAEPVVIATTTNKTAKRADIAKHTQYKMNLEKTKSGATKRLDIAIKITLLVLLIDISIIFISSQILSSEYSTSLSRIRSSIEASHSAYAIVYGFRRINWLANGIGPEPIYNVTEQIGNWRTKLDVQLNIFHEFDVNELSNLAKPEIKAFWFDTQVNETVWGTSPDGNRIPIINTINMWNLVYRYFQNARLLMLYSDNDFIAPDTRSEWRYIYDNIPTMYFNFKNEYDIYDDINYDLRTTFLLVLQIFLGASGAILLILAGILFYPAVRKIKTERSDTLKLFLTIPKGSINNIISSLLRENKEIEDDAFDESSNDHVIAIEHIASSTSMMNKLTVRYIAILLFMYFIIVGTFVGEEQYISSTKTAGPNMVVSGKRTGALYGIENLSMELIHYDPYWLPNIDMGYLSLTRGEYQEMTNELLNGNATTGVPGGVLSDSFTFKLTYQDYCTLPTNLTIFGLPDTKSPRCQGLATLSEIILTNSFHLLETNNDLLNFTNLDYREIVLLFEFGEIHPWHKEITSRIEAVAITTLTQMKTGISVVFAFSVLFLALFYVLLVPLEREINIEHSRIMKMMLMIPNTVIESLPAVKEYLETGGTTNSQFKLKHTMIEIENRSKSIIDSSIDSIVVTNEKGMIDIYNPAAEKMFGFPAVEMYGKSLLNLLPPAICEGNAKLQNYFNSTNKGQLSLNSQEMKGQRKDGSIFHISMSINEVRVGGKLYYAAFIRDTEMQLRVDKLLGTILPQSVAEILKQDINNPDRPVIAEAYKEVTILFADIVGFTNLSTKISPHELIYMLNTIFSEFDSLCEKFHVEKIKTVGDCYMCVGGVPERTFEHANNIIEFAIEILNVIERFNVKHNAEVKIRIGINSGSVVAGVIGSRKFSFDIWGDAVNVASRMESTGIPNQIQVSQATYDLLKRDYVFEERERQQVKGKGMMVTYLYKGRASEMSELAFRHKQHPDFSASFSQLNTTESGV